MRHSGLLARWPKVIQCSKPGINSCVGPTGTSHVTMPFRVWMHLQNNANRAIRSHQCAVAAIAPSTASFRYMKKVPTRPPDRCHRTFLPLNPLNYFMIFLSFAHKCSTYSIILISKPHEIFHHIAASIRRGTPFLFGIPSEKMCFVLGQKHNRSHQANAHSVTQQL